jgi:hypothetical protein
MDIKRTARDKLTYSVEKIPADIETKECVRIVDFDFGVEQGVAVSLAVKICPGDDEQTIVMRALQELVNVKHVLIRPALA